MVSPDRRDDLAVTGSRINENLRATNNDQLL